MLRIYCRYDETGTHLTLDSPPLDDDGKIIVPLSLAYDKGSELDLCIRKFHSKEEYIRDDFYAHMGWSITYLPLTLDEIKNIHNMKIVTESDLKGLRESYDSYPDFSKQLETVAVAVELLK